MYTKYFDTTFSSPIDLTSEAFRRLIDFAEDRELKVPRLQNSSVTIFDVKLSRRMSIKSSRASKRVTWLNSADVSRTIAVIIFKAREQRLTSKRRQNLTKLRGC